MGLKKEITFENGVNIEYHYINDIQVDNKNKTCKLKIDSYTDETYRQKEKDNRANQEKHEELVQLIFAENNKSEQERDVEQVVLWSEEANNLIGSFKEDLVLKVVTKDIELKDVTDYNLSNLYEMLKQEELFTNAEDC